MELFFKFIGILAALLIPAVILHLAFEPFAKYDDRGSSKKGRYIIMLIVMIVATGFEIAGQLRAGCSAPMTQFYGTGTTGLTVHACNMTGIIITLFIFAILSTMLIYTLTIKIKSVFKKQYSIPYSWTHSMGVINGTSLMYTISMVLTMTGII